MITSGSQQALFLLATLLLRPRATRSTSRTRATSRRGSPGGATGAQDRAPARSTSRGCACRRRPTAGSSLVYTTPSRQFPTGVSMSLPRRLALIDFAGRTKAWVIEDDYDSELRYGAPPLPSLQSLDRSGRVIYVGTFSKLLFPSLRLGYVVVPEPLLDALRRAQAPDRRPPAARRPGDPRPVPRERRVLLAHPALPPRLRRAPGAVPQAVRRRRSCRSSSRTPTAA